MPHRVAIQGTAKAGNFGGPFCFAAPGTALILQLWMIVHGLRRPYYGEILIIVVWTRFLSRYPNILGVNRPGTWRLLQARDQGELHLEHRPVLLVVGEQ